MAKRKRYNVVPNGNLWQVTHDGYVLSNHYTKQAAIDSGQAVAKANQPSQLVVYRANGTIEFEWTYGNDPYPPVG
ncbi:DUF2188 domain-containing protein [Symbioplanes lichenis]|uniref:DUF2188 domain-containing protein n=1 Tax=Symbioplanes lichenis TaxID=1629072 RepID=UPI002738855A|nr:DUF2188 domain-containing protein [Actinoplanes lichenis]